MRFMLDTNILSAVVRDPHGALAQRVRGHERDISTSILVVSELRYGVAKRGSTKLARSVERVLQTIDIAAFDEPADRMYADLRSNLERMGAVIGQMDLLIAAHALSRGDVLVTDNTREFTRVPDLAVVNWLRDEPPAN